MRAFEREVKNKMKQNATISTKKEKGYISIYLQIEGLNNPIQVKVNDFGGQQKEKARKLTYKIHCLLNEVK